MDNTFKHAIYYFFMNDDIILYALALIISLVTLLSFLKILRTWGDI